MFHARQRIHMKQQALFSSKDKSKKKLLCSLRVKWHCMHACLLLLSGTMHDSNGSFLGLKINP